MNGIRSHPANRDSRHGAYGFFSSGQNTHHFESYLSRKGHQDVQPSHQVKPAPDRERVSVPLPEGTGKPEGVWNAFNGNYTQQDWANYARGQAAPAAKRPANTATAATLPAAPMASPPLRSPTPLIDLEFGSTLPATPTGNSTLPATPTVNSSIFADLLDLDFTDCVSTTSTTTTTTTTATAAAAAAAITTTADTGTDTPKDSTGTEKAAVPVEESTLIDFSDSSAGTVPDRASSLSASSESFGEAGQSDDHLAADGYTTGNSDYNDDDSDSDSGDDDDDHHRQLGFDKGLENEKDSESNTKGIFVDFETLANLRTELLDANVTWEDLLTRLKGGRA
ncbi:hypothetical protein BGW39_008659 [Mortierella sp. 14UC]|nr:hypothetical protein BGW39_008659 [Mortierella sp. 14UC]